VGLKPPANQGKARLRGLYRIISSKTISPLEAQALPERMEVRAQALPERVEAPAGLVCLIARGGVRMAAPSLTVEFQSSAPCLPFFVHRIDKVELSVENLRTHITATFQSSHQGVNHDKSGYHTRLLLIHSRMQAAGG